MFNDDGNYDKEVSSYFLYNVPILFSTEDNSDLLKSFFIKGKSGCHLVYGV